MIPRGLAAEAGRELQKNADYFKILWEKSAGLNSPGCTHSPASLSLGSSASPFLGVLQMELRGPVGSPAAFCPTWMLGGEEEEVRKSRCAGAGREGRVDDKGRLLLCQVGVG